MTLRPVSDKAEVSIEFPDKLYMGSFGRESRFDAAAEADGVVLRLARGGDHKRTVDIHLHHYLLADILAAIAGSIAARPPLDEAHREPLAAAAAALSDALSRRA